MPADFLSLSSFLIGFFFSSQRTAPAGGMNSAGCGVPHKGIYTGEYHTWYHNLLPLGGFTG